MNSVKDEVRRIAQTVKTEHVHLRNTSTNKRNEILYFFAEELLAQSSHIIAENKTDYEREKARGMSAGLLDRLLLTETRIVDLADAVKQVAQLDDPIGVVVSGRTLANGLKLRQVSVPMGVVAMIYEARPTVSADAVALAIKSANAVITRGGSAAKCSNAAIIDCAHFALQKAGLPQVLVSSIDHLPRESVSEILQARGLVDLAIPRGGAGLIQMVVQTATVPVIETGVGNCHVYVHESADLSQAFNIVINSKTSRVGVCNAAETLLVDKKIAPTFLPSLARALVESKVTLHLCDKSLDLLLSAGMTGEYLVPATEEDWGKEYLALDLAVRIVDDIERAVAHIARHSSGHTEAICADNAKAIDFFLSRVDSAALMVNASTRFTDGGQFGLGCEIGISTQKLHARGPMGLSALTSTSFHVIGQGHIRT